MARYLYALGLLFVSAVSVAVEATAIPGLVRAMIPIPITLPDGHQATLEGLMVRPEGPGKFPLIILVHGSPRSEPGKSLEAYRLASPTGLAGPALVFAQHGYAAVSIMRRGFGRSDGPYAELIEDPCDSTDYLRVGRISAEDVVGTVAALRRASWVDPDRVVLLGYSTGGLAVSAAGSNNPPGVLAILNFGGGRGSFRPDQVCSPDRLVEAFAAFGGSTKIPSLWMVAENDHYLGVPLARRMFDAYASAGASAQLKVLPPFATDGHLMLIAGSTDLWWPAVETFLESLRLPTSLVVRFPPPTPLPPPRANEACSAFFRDYVAAPTNAKAFAVNPEGRCGFNLTARSLDEAEEEAMKLCNARWSDCKLYAAGQELVKSFE